MADSINGSQALIKSLLDQGVDTLFAYPGGTIMPVYDALYSCRSELKQILVRHEQAATHAAEGYARVSGRTGVCIVTSGPGATNTITGISDAMLDSTPMVVIAGQVQTQQLGSDAFQEIDLVGVTQPISKWSYQIRSAKDVAWAVARAFYIAASGRPGPVVLDFTKNAQTEMVEYEPQKVEFVRSYIPVPHPQIGVIDEAARLINSASKPLALVGQGVELGRAHKQLADFLEKGDIPAGRTLLGLSALPTAHPLNMGMLGLHGNLAPNVMTNRCDLLIAIGMRFDDRVTGLTKAYASQAKIIHLDIDKSEFNKNIRCDLSVLGDCRETLALITERMESASHKEWIESFSPLREREYSEVIKEAVTPGSGPIKMGEVVSRVSANSPLGTVLTTDVGLNQMFAARYFSYSHPRSIITSGGLGTMGFGMPAAIGATQGAPDRCVVLFTGDGGFQMNIQELGTIMETGAPVKIVLLNNNFLGNVRMWQQLFFGSRYSCTRMYNPDFSLISGAYGIKFTRVTERGELEEGIKAMFSHSGPHILEVACEEEENVMPMIPLGNAVDCMILKPTL